MPYKTQSITKTDDDLVFRRIHICLHNEQSCWCPFGVICSTCTCGVIENVTFKIRARAVRYVTDHQGIPAQKRTDGPISQIPQCASPICPHNALDKYATTHHFVTEMCTCMHISVTNGALWDMCLMHCEICEMGSPRESWRHKSCATPTTGGFHLRGQQCRQRFHVLSWYAWILSIY